MIFPQVPSVLASSTYQPHLETVLDRRCKSLPTVDVRQGLTVDGIELTADAVLLTAAAHDGSRIGVQARFVVAADGGGGFVRPALGIGISDYGFEENWLVCDFRKRLHLESLPTFRQVCDPAQPTAIVQIGPHHHRFWFMLDRDETAEAATNERRVWERVAAYLRPTEAELVRVANYVFRSRIAERWRSGPIMLAGDAAHEMPPFLAQGMCSGIRDSHNLAWKLDLVLRGYADAAILDTYQPEREPHVRFITEKAIELGRVQTLRDPEQASVRDARMLAQRRAHHEPEKLQFPGLAAGLIADGDSAAGELFPQGAVRCGTRDGRFDDLVGEGPCILVRNPAALTAIGEYARLRWRALGGRIAALGRSGDGDDLVTTIADTAGTYAAWFDAHRCEAAVIRPDWYLYGIAADGVRLAVLLEDVYRALVAPRSARVTAPTVRG